MTRPWLRRTSLLAGPRAILHWYHSPRWFCLVLLHALLYQCLVVKAEYIDCMLFETALPLSDRVTVRSGCTQ
jgi:hypothetical protein